MTAPVRFSKPCGQCGGKGWFAVQSSRGAWETDKHPCPSCVGGWLPDDETVEAAMSDPLPYEVGVALNHNWKPEGIALIHRDIVRKALVAAARYQFERDGEFSECETGETGDKG